ncbi:hypothetical protein EDC01DRAFT_46934 [Geopyxis carbonaria]|nr:hypothetical protein EDC01DRAFT_46934 [Geopyxis carbonaria]
MLDTSRRKLELLAEAVGVDVVARLRPLAAAGTVVLELVGSCEAGSVVLGELDLRCLMTDATCGTADAQRNSTAVITTQPPITTNSVTTTNNITPRVAAPVPSTPVHPHLPTPASSDAGDDAARPSKRPRKPPPPSAGLFPDSKCGLGLLERIWYTLYRGPPLTLSAHATAAGAYPLPKPQPGTMSHATFHSLNTSYSALFATARGTRIHETILQATWTRVFSARLSALADSPPHRFSSPTELRQVALTEAASAFSISVKELRNKLAIWQSYAALADAGGWAALVFAGDGVYTICKYRRGLDSTLFDALRRLRAPLELAADTLHPSWRRLVGEELRFAGHPHAYTLTPAGPVPLALSYPWTRGYQLIDACVLDSTAWGARDPRRVCDAAEYDCGVCGARQAEDAANACRCFPDLFGPTAVPAARAPVQVFDTGTKGNGVVARWPLPAGVAVGEFVGLITRGVSGADVMAAGGRDGAEKYQISQASVGNWTRFVNHSCAPNAQFERFVWRGVERIVVVVVEGKGVADGEELTVDYSGVYWEGLEKVCRCGAKGCRYSGPERIRGGDGGGCGRGAADDVIPAT